MRNIDSDNLLSYDEWDELGRPWVMNAPSLDVAFDQLSLLVSDDCVDNHRWYNVDTDENYDEYMERYNSGCCGSFDITFYINGVRFMVGINYGH